MQLGSMLTKLSKEKRISMAELSRRSGVPKQTLHNWTTGRRSVDPNQLRSIAEVFEVSVHFLLFGESDPFEQVGQEILKEIFTGDVRVTLHRIQRIQRR